MQDFEKTLQEELQRKHAKALRGNHLSNTTCLPLVYFKSGEQGSKLWWPLTRKTTHKTNEAVLDK